MDCPITSIRKTGDRPRPATGRFRPAFAAAVVLLLLSGSTALGQEQRADSGSSRIAVGVSLGYNSFALDDVRQYYDILLNFYRESGIPIPTQRDYPGNLIVGVEVLRPIASVVEVGLGSRYTWTSAYSSYEDYAGTADVEGRVSMVTLEGIIRRNQTPASLFEMYIGMRGGLVYGWSTFSQRIVFNDYPGENLDELLSASGTGFTVEGFLEVIRRFNNIALGVSAGYRYAMISEMDADLSVDGQSQGGGTLPLEHDLSGFIICARFEIAL